MTLGRKRCSWRCLWQSPRGPSFLGVEPSEKRVKWPVPRGTPICARRGKARCGALNSARQNGMVSFSGGSSVCCGESSWLPSRSRLAPAPVAGSAIFFARRRDELFDKNAIFTRRIVAVCCPELGEFIQRSWGWSTAARAHLLPRPSMIILDASLPHGLGQLPEKRGYSRPARAGKD